MEKIKIRYYTTESGKVAFAFFIEFTFAADFTIKSIVMRDPLRGFSQNLPDAKPERQYVLSFFELNYNERTLSTFFLNTFLYFLTYS